MMWTVIGGAGVLLAHVVASWFEKRAIRMTYGQFIQQGPMHLVRWGTITYPHERVQFVAINEWGSEVFKSVDERAEFLFIRLPFVKKWAQDWRDYDRVSEWRWHHLMICWRGGFHRHPKNPIWPNGWSYRWIVV